MIFLNKFSCLLFVVVASGVRGKLNSLKNAAPLTESLGQEVIEIAGPGAKGLPPNMDEEPSAEVEEEPELKSSSVLPLVTKKTERKPNPNDISAKVKTKTIGKIDEEDAKIEKELSDLYRDNSEYKTDNEEAAKFKAVKTEAAVITTTERLTTIPQKVVEEKSIERSRNKDFNFQPADLDSKAAIQVFRTSVDEISCNKKQLTGAVAQSTSSTCNDDEKPDAGTSLKIDKSISSLIIAYLTYVFLKM